MFATRVRSRSRVQLDPVGDAGLVGEIADPRHSVELGRAAHQPLELAVIADGDDECAVPDRLNTS